LQCLGVIVAKAIVLEDVITVLQTGTYVFLDQAEWAYQRRAAWRHMAEIPDVLAWFVLVGIKNKKFNNYL
jgi:predicted kinase